MVFTTTSCRVRIHIKVRGFRAGRYVLITSLTSFEMGKGCEQKRAS